MRIGRPFEELIRVATVAAPAGRPSYPLGRRRRQIAGIALAAALAGCASTPRGMLLPVAPALETDHVDMLAATTRALGGAGRAL